MPSEWLSSQDAIQFVEAAEEVERKRAKLLLAEAAIAGEVLARGLIGDEWYSIEPERWKAELHEWMHYHNTFGDFFAIEFRAEHLSAWRLNRADISAEEPRPKRPAGRKPKLDWHEVFGEVLRRVHENGMPDNDQAFAAELLLWCREQYDKEVADSVMRANIRTWFRPLRRQR